MTWRETTHLVGLTATVTVTLELGVGTGRDGGGASRMKVPFTLPRWRAALQASALLTLLLGKGFLCTDRPTEVEVGPGSGGMLLS